MKSAMPAPARCTPQAVDNVAQALAQLSVGSNPGSAAVTAPRPDLEYRTCATSSKADAKAAAQRMIGPPRNLYERAA